MESPSMDFCSAIQHQEQRTPVGDRLHTFPAEDYDVPPGFVWVASEYNALSFDSRYYGPIQISHLRHL